MYFSQVFCHITKPISYAHNVNVTKKKYVYILYGSEKNYREEGKIENGASNKPNTRHSYLFFIYLFLFRCSAVRMHCQNESVSTKICVVLLVSVSTRINLYLENDKKRATLKKGESGDNTKVFKRDEK